MTPATIIHGEGPVILSQPHSGTYVPNTIYRQLNTLGRQLLDTDWHVPELYEGLISDATVVRASFSRYVIDANRDPEGHSLYPGQNTTGLVPTQSFDGEPIWETLPTAKDIADRVATYHRPYHQAIATEIKRVKSLHGYALLYDCHSIRSRIPFLFDDQLPDFNIGDNSGASCDGAITTAIAKTCASATAFTSVVNGRFKGGWTTRHYGHPSSNIHAVQMELAQRTYLQSETPPFAYDPDRAAPLRAVLGNVLTIIQCIVPSKSKMEK